MELIESMKLMEPTQSGSIGTPAHRRSYTGFKAGIAVAMMIAISWIFAGCVSTGDARSNSDTEEPMYVFVQAHRGASEHYPELTMAAFEAALSAGADRLEMDLALTSDDHVVLMHDTTVDRTTDGSGRVRSHTLEEIKRLDAGSWKDEQFAGEQVPSLREVLSMVGDRAVLNLEIKSHNTPFPEVVDTIERTLEIIEEYDAYDSVVFSSFDRRALDEVRNRKEDARLLLIDWSEPGGYSGLDVAINNNFYAWTPAPEYATRERIGRAREAGLSTHVGATPGRRALRFVEWGIAGLSSNDPASLVEFLEDNGYRNESVRGDDRFVRE